MLITFVPREGVAFSFCLEKLYLRRDPSLALAGRWSSFCLNVGKRSSFFSRNCRCHTQMKRLTRPMCTTTSNCAFQHPPLKCTVIKELSNQKIREMRGRLYEDPLREVSALQYLSSEEHANVLQCTEVRGARLMFHYCKLRLKNS